MTDIISAKQTCCNKSKILYIVSVKKQTYFCTKISTRKKKSSLDLYSNKYSLSPQKNSCDLEEWPWSLKLYECIKINTCYHTVSNISNSIQEKQTKNNNNKQTNKKPTSTCRLWHNLHNSFLFFFLFVCVHNTLIQSTQD